MRADLVADDLSRIIAMLNSVAGRRESSLHVLRPDLHGHHQMVGGRDLGDLSVAVVESQSYDPQGY
jgi:hypothetical protein